MDVDSCIRAALTALGGDRRLLPGARVATQAIRLGAESNFDFREALRASGKSFLDVVKIMLPGSDLRFVPRQGSDFLLGFDTAPLPDFTQVSPAIRNDFFRAFTRIRDANARYLVDDDRIVYGEEPPLGGVLIPKPTTEDAWNLRLRFAESLEQSTAKTQLIDLASDETRSLSRYSALLHAHRLDAPWIKFRYGTLRAAISQWAADGNIPVRAAWFGAPGSQVQRTPVSKKPVREALLSSLTTEELTRVLIPADIVQALLERQTKG